MALADSVPGVSGGTVAFVLGFYDDFIGALYAITNEALPSKKRGLIFLAKLGIGWCIGMASSVMILSSLFTSHIYDLSSLFLGLTLFSLPIIIKEETDVLAGKYKNLLYTVIGIALVFLITYFNPSSGTGTDMDISSLSLGLGLYIFCAAMIAICAMVLPGISGSTLLLIFGLYVPIITAIKEFLHFNFAYFPVLCIFGLGVLAGILTIIKLVKNALVQHRSATVYFILGLMLGSLYAIVMGPASLKIPQLPLSWATFNIPAFVSGGILLLMLNSFKIFAAKKIQK